MLGNISLPIKLIYNNNNLNERFSVELRYNEDLNERFSVESRYNEDLNELIALSTVTPLLGLNI